GTAAQAEPERARHIGGGAALARADLEAGHVYPDRYRQVGRSAGVDRLSAIRADREPGIGEPAVGQHLVDGPGPLQVVADVEVAAGRVAAARVVVTALAIAACPAGIASRHHQVVLAAFAAERC